MKKTAAIFQALVAIAVFFIANKVLAFDELQVQFVPVSGHTALLITDCAQHLSETQYRGYVDGIQIFRTDDGLPCFSTYFIDNLETFYGSYTGSPFTARWIFGDNLSGGGEIAHEFQFAWNGSAWTQAAPQGFVRLISPEAGSTTAQTTVLLTYQYYTESTTTNLYTGYSVQNVSTGFQYLPDEVQATTTAGYRTRQMQFAVGDRILWNAYVRSASSSLRYTDFPRVFSVVVPPVTTTPLYDSAFSTTSYESFAQQGEFLSLVSKKFPFDYIFLVPEILFNISGIATDTPSFAMDINLGATTTHVVLFSKGTVETYLSPSLLLIFTSLISAGLWLSWIYFVFHKVLNLL